jgi:hypothetical protein
MRDWELRQHKTNQAEMLRSINRTCKRRQRRDMIITGIEWLTGFLILLGLLIWFASGVGPVGG